MKRGILIAGIITIICCAVAVLSLGIAGGVNMFTWNLAVADGSAEDVPELLTIATVCLALAGYFAVGLIMSIILVATRNSSMGKVGGIIFGVLGFLLGSFLPGIFYLVDSIKNR